MKRSISNAEIFEMESIWAILGKIAPPVMLSQLIQSLYNIVDSYFIGRYSGAALTALSVIYPVQLIIIAFAVGTGVGVNTQMSRYYAHGRTEQANHTAGTGLVLALISWAVFSVISALCMPMYMRASAESADAVRYGIIYGDIVCIGSLGLFVEATWSRVLHSQGNMRRPMVAQIVGAIVNVLLDPLLIFGWGPIPSLGVAGAAWATIAGQFAAALVVLPGYRKPCAIRLMLGYAKKIYALGYPSIFMQLMYTVYIMALNLILAEFSDEAVTVLGLYYKIQAFFFIPMNGLQTCMVPLISYNYAQRSYERCRRAMRDCMLISASLMLVGIACFELIPRELIGIFSTDPTVLEIGERAFRIIAVSFLPIVPSIMMPVFFQAIGAAGSSILLSLTRQVFCLIPLFYLFSRIGLGYAWLAFPIAEVITGSVGLILYAHKLKQWRVVKPSAHERSTHEMKLITAVVNRRDAGDVCLSLAESGIYFTRISSTGGFLTSGNTTLLIGTKNEDVEHVLSVIRSHCSRREETVTQPLPSATPGAAHPTQVTVGGATVFITDVERFEKL